MNEEIYTEKSKEYSNMKYGKKDRYKLLCYTGIGLATFVTANVLLYIFRRILQMPDGLSVMIAYVIVTFCHFMLNNYLTFRRSKQPLWNRLRGHIVVSVVNYFIGTTTTTVIIVYVFDNNFVATACSTAVTFLLGYTLLNRFVYKMNDEGEKNDNC